MRIITAKALKNEVNYFHKNEFDYFLMKNLPQNADKITTLAVILKNKFEEERIFYHVFNNSKKEAENDIPFFHKNAPDGYSFFCCRNEYSQLTNFLKKNKKTKKVKQIEPEKIELEPAPNKKHYVCQICKVKFEDYLEHIHSKFHEKNKMNFTDSFLRMKNTFKRIVIFNKEKKEKIKTSTHKPKEEIKEENKMNKVNGKENNSSNITSENYQNDVTKCDTPPKEKKTYSKKKKKIKNKKIINDENTINKKELENKEISPKDINFILNSIKCMTYYKQKRKKNDLNKNIFHDNYLYDLQKVTGKISHFNSLYNI